MAREVSYRLDDTTVVRFEIDPVDSWREVGADEVIANIRDAVEPLVAGARVVSDQLRTLSPDEIKVTFGIKVSGKANWVVAKAATEANFEVELTWKPGSGSSQAPSAPPAPPQT